MSLLPLSIIRWLAPLLGPVHVLVARGWLRESEVDAVLAWLYQPQWVTVARKGLQGLWKDMPIFVNDLSSMYWA